MLFITLDKRFRGGNAPQVVGGAVPTAPLPRFLCLYSKDLRMILNTASQQYFNDDYATQLPGPMYNPPADHGAHFELQIILKELYLKLSMLNLDYMGSRCSA